MATALYPNSQFETTTHESDSAPIVIGSPEEHLAADLESLCEAGFIEARRDQFGRVRYSLKAGA